MSDLASGWRGGRFDEPTELGGRPPGELGDSRELLASTAPLSQVVSLSASQGGDRVTVDAHGLADLFLYQEVGGEIGFVGLLSLDTLLTPRSKRSMRLLSCGYH
ncbi:MULTISPECIES: hypothetical protein [unclassified Nocardia]|uniref:hypothetical protein n=1 Tax=unclassified Nocardia TaxID=2637762 RepID=UPI00278C6EBF|nr:MULTISPECIES: hypothetical protein [unclassified Nocardia]